MSKYCAELMPLLLDYLSSLNEAKVGHVTKAFYALENFMENLGKLEKNGQTPAYHCKSKHDSSTDIN